MLRGFILAAMMALSSFASAQQAVDMNWWREARFGMFIHWGLYAVPAGHWNGKPVNGAGEWIMHDEKIPVADYAKIAGQFNPTEFDANQWVTLAKSAGMKYIVITAKHHDGFAMFHTKASSFNIVDATPFKRDPIAELSEACRKQGLKFGVYYSQAQDWHHAGGAAIGGHWDTAQDGNYDDYLKNVAQPEVKELLSNYGPISVIWWDTPVEMNRERAQPFAELLSLQPGIISNDRLGSGARADYETPEQRIPANGLGGQDWETCMTINETWGYKTDDRQFKSTQTLLHNLIDIGSKGGNYLLNVGPTDKGIIPPEEAKRLTEIGQWLDKNGEAIYGTTAGPFKKRLPYGRVTRKTGKLYFSLFDWPKSESFIIPVSNEVTKAYLLRNPAKLLETTKTDDGTRISLTGEKPDPLATVVVMEVSGEPGPIIRPIQPDADGSITLRAEDATIHGNSAHLESRRGVSNIGFWTDAKDSIEWSFQLPTTGSYALECEYSCKNNAAKSVVEFSVGSVKLHAAIPATRSWDDFKTLSLGEVNLSQPGEIKVTAKAESMPNAAVMNLRSVRLVRKK